MHENRDQQTVQDQLHRSHSHFFTTLILGLLLLLITPACSQTEQRVVENSQSEKAKPSEAEPADWLHLPGNIGDVRAQGPGAMVTAEGYVTTTPGSFAGVNYDMGFALQDDCAGIYVRVFDDPSLVLNQHVRVSGILSSRRKHLILNVKIEDIEVLEGSRSIAPTRVNTVDISDSTEGKLVTVEGVMSSGALNDLPYGWKFYMNDGSGHVVIYIASSVDDADPFEIPWLVHNAKFRLTGYSSDYTTHSEIMPRSLKDFTPLKAED